jgi:hypothetical protein
MNYYYPNHTHTNYMNYYYTNYTHTNYEFIMISVVYTKQKPTHMNYYMHTNYEFIMITYQLIV